MSKNIVSIIIINYNGEKWLKKALTSLMGQTYKHFECIVVDNNSFDNSVAYIKNYPNVKIVASKKNLGFAGGNNLGIDAAKGEYILLLNSDAWIEKDFIEKILDYYLKHDFDVLAPREALYTGEKRPEYITTIDPFGHPVYYLDKSKSSFYLSGVCLFFKKDLYIETKGLDNNFFMYSEETDWFWRLNLLKKTFRYIDNLYVYHAGAGSTGTGIKYNVFLWRNQNTLQMLLKNYVWYTLLWVLPIYLLQNIFEVVFFLVIGKPKISLSYIEGWIFNVRNWPKIKKTREWVQKNRKLTDIKILTKMYPGFAKVNHLLIFLHNKIEK